MSVTTITTQELNQNLGHAKQATQDGPVLITDCGKLAHVLLSAKDYQRLTGTRPNLVDALSMPGLSEIEFEPPRLSIHRQKVDF